MKLFIAIAIVAIIAVVILAMRGSGTRVTTVEHRRVDDEDSDRG